MVKRLNSVSAVAVLIRSFRSIHRILLHAVEYRSSYHAVVMAGKAGRQAGSSRAKEGRSFLPLPADIFL